MFNKQDSKVDKKLEVLDERLQESLILLKKTPDFSKPDKIGRVFDNVRRILM